MPTSDRMNTLLTERDTLRERLQRLHADKTRAAGAIDADFAEQAVQRENDDVVDGIEAASLTALRAVEHALARIAQGQGDNCERCGALIDSRRLAAEPSATRCRDCA